MEEFPCCPRSAGLDRQIQRDTSISSTANLLQKEEALILQSRMVLQSISGRVRNGFMPMTFDPFMDLPGTQPPP